MSFEYSNVKLHICISVVFLRLVLIIAEHVITHTPRICKTSKTDLDEALVPYSINPLFEHCPNMRSNRCSVPERVGKVDGPISVQAAHRNRLL